MQRPEQGFFWELCKDGLRNTLKPKTYSVKIKCKSAHGSVGVLIDDIIVL